MNHMLDGCQIPHRKGPPQRVTRRRCGPLLHAKIFPISATVEMRDHQNRKFTQFPNISAQQERIFCAIITTFSAFLGVSCSV